ncbi:MAG: NUDIX domain-containing protein [Parcubacteria group bacterium]|jgi:8-oxo-dGTP pyrophosphatase MutT (NUDIX family)
MKNTRDFTANITIVHDNKVLLHFHKDLKRWLPVGGHIEKDELPEEAAIREAREEAGLEIELYDNDKADRIADARQSRLKMPMHIFLEDIHEGHQHIDFIYYAKANTFELNPEEDESVELRWFTAEELDKLDAGQPIKYIAREALELLGGKK